jgi:hypothetical protein
MPFAKVETSTWARPNPVLPKWKWQLRKPQVAFPNVETRVEESGGWSDQSRRPVWRQAQLGFAKVGEGVRETEDAFPRRDGYLPLVDDDAIDAVIRPRDGSFTTVQIKARSKDVVERDAALFAAIPHEVCDNYWFIFYSEKMDMTWIMTSNEFVAASVQNKTGKNVGKRSIWFNGNRRGLKAGEREDYCKPQFEKYVARDFSRLTGRYPEG